MVNHPHRELLLDQSSPPGVSEANASDRKLEIAVVFTSVEATLAAMRRAVALLKGLDGHISLLDFETVPRQLPIENPPVSIDFTKRRLLAIAEASSAETTAYVYLCRCPFEALTSVLKGGSLIVIGCRSKWWPTWETKLARKLQRAGYQIILHKSA
jgi:hypothetical protein